MKEFYPGRDYFIGHITIFILEMRKKGIFMV
jgi:hypothetical protein